MGPLAEFKLDFCGGLADCSFGASMSEAFRIYCEARARTDEINQRDYDGRMTMEDGDKAILALCHTRVMKSMRQDMEPVNKVLISMASLSALPGSLPEVPQFVQEYRNHIEKKWIGVWDRIVNKRF